MDEDLKLIEQLRQNSGVSALGRLMGHAATTITRLHAEIERLKSDVSDLVRAGSDEATASTSSSRRRGKLMEKKTTITYTLTPGRKLAFVGAVIRMWDIPYRTRWELIWTALTSKKGLATATLYWPPAECARFLEVLQGFLGEQGRG